jgi:hypothetical protein
MKSLELTAGSDEALGLSVCSIKNPANNSRKHNDDTRWRILQEVSEALRSLDGQVTNIETVVGLTRFSTDSISKQFGGTKELFLALVEQLAATVLEPLRAPRPMAVFETQLREFASRVASVYSSSNLQGLYRMALTDAVRKNGSARLFYQLGPGLVTAELARFLEDGRRAGVIRAADCGQLASHLMALLRVNLDLSGSSYEPGDGSQAVDLFLAGVGTGANSASIAA